MTDLKTANETLNALVIKLADARNRLAEAEEKARDYAFDAHTGELGAQKELDRLNTAAAKATVEIKGIESAVAEAKKRVDAAAAAELDERERDDARKALGLLEDFARRGDELQHALDKFISKYEELSRDFRQLDALGYPPSTWPMVKIQMKAATTTALQFTDLRTEFLAPHERRDFRTVIENWAGSVRGKIQARLNRAARNAAA
jgi:hypothetical protein